MVVDLLLLWLFIYYCYLLFPYLLLSAPNLVVTMMIGIIYCILIIIVLTPSVVVMMMVGVVIMFIIRWCCWHWYLWPYPLFIGPLLSYLLLFIIIIVPTFDHCIYLFIRAQSMMVGIRYMVYIPHICCPVVLPFIIYSHYSHCPFCPIVVHCCYSFLYSHITLFILVLSFHLLCVNPRPGDIGDIDVVWEWKWATFFHCPYLFVVMMVTHSLIGPLLLLLWPYLLFYLLYYSPLFVDVWYR